jgi:hypothetical protein
MFEEAQLYSPVTTEADGSGTVHLADDHPGANDPAYRERRGFSRCSIAPSRSTRSSTWSARFFTTCTDESIAAMAQRAGAAT